MDPTFDLGRFLDLLTAAGHPGPVRRSGRRWTFACPACSKRALKMRTASGFFTCYYCKFINDMSGPAHRLLAKFLNCSERTAAEQLYGDEARAVLALPDHPFLEEDEDLEELLPPALLWEYHHHLITDPKAQRGAAYLEGRGVPVGVAAEYGVRYSPVERRVLFPVETEGRLVGWQGRLVVDHRYVDAAGVQQEGLKVQSTKDIPRDRALMFGDRVVDVDTAFLVEGPIDALHGHLAGGNVAAMGKVVTPGQVRLLLERNVRTICLGLDPDAQEEVVLMVRQYFGQVRFTQALVPAGMKDFGETSMQEVADAIRSAKEVFPYHIGFYFGEPKKVEDLG